MGVEKITIKNMRVLEVDTESKQVVLVGSVPGANNYTLLRINKNLK